MLSSSDSIRIKVKGGRGERESKSKVDKGIALYRQPVTDKPFLRSDAAIALKVTVPK